MAIVTAVREKTQSRTAMGKVIRYVSQDKKTLYENEDRKYRLLSGQNCCGETAMQEFMATKRRYDKEKGRYFYHYVQSFKPDEQATPDEIHQMGLELARYFEGYEVLVATHIDRDHRHNHLIVNSVSCDTGLKLQFNEKSLEKLRIVSDRICRAHGLEVLKPYRKPKLKNLNTREYRAAVRGDSWKFRLMNAIDQAMAQARTRAAFIERMRRMGYGVKWLPQYKYVTYTTPEGRKCRDNRLHEDKYLKANMEGFYAEFRGLEEAQRPGGSIEPSLSADDLRHSERAMGGHAPAPDRDGARAAGAAGQYRQAAYRAEFGTGASGFSSADLPRAGELPGQPDRGYGPEERGFDGGNLPGLEGGADPESDGGRQRAGGDTSSPGYVGTDTQEEVVRAGLPLHGDLLSLAKAVEDLVNPRDTEAERQREEESKRPHRQHRKKKHEMGQQMSL